MKIKTLVSLSALTAALVACGGGDIQIDAQNNSTSNETTDNSIVGDNSGNVGSGGDEIADNCASYVSGGLTISGEAEGVNCLYRTDFSDSSNPIVTESEIFFADLENDGVHIFNGSLAIGASYNTDAEMAEAGLFEGGDGTVVRIEAGATLAFRTSDDFMVVNRGSQLFAEGEEGAPITLTSVSDAVDGTVGPEDVQQWGGLVINGFGVSNKCTYDGTRGVDLVSTAECHVAVEGKAGEAETFYGGNNDADSSGILTYFIVKHTGAQVSEGNELNGISFGGVGSGTRVSHIQAYATYDDGIEFFGGAVNVDHYVALYVRDDSIDIDEGYIGTVDYALVIQSETDGNHCMESDGLGSYGDFDDPADIADFVARGLHSAATVRNVTCILSANGHPDDAGTGTHGAGQGFRIREAHMPTLENILITSAYSSEQLFNDDQSYNYCLNIVNDGEQAALDGVLTLSSSIIACQDLVNGDLVDTSTIDWVNTNGGNLTLETAVEGFDPTDATETGFVILDGFYSLDITSTFVDGEAANATITPTEGRSFVGAVTADDDWTANWAYGLDENNRGQALWFEE